MKVSKAIILDTARRLFNRDGLAAVTARVIAGELKISPGSFSYHFPDKRRLVVELYRSMIAEMNADLKKTETAAPCITTLLEAFWTLALVQVKYKFFFLNLFEILRSFPAIRHLHKRALARERTMAKALFDGYRAAGVLKSDITPREIKYILRQSQILFAYWIVDAESGDFASEEQAVRHYTEVCCSPLLPYLSEDSKTEFMNYFKTTGK